VVLLVLLHSGHGATVCGVGRNENNLKEMVDEKAIASYIVADLAADNECERAGTTLLPYANYGLTLFITSF
jgi:hypothetical protein